jgi:6-phosphogluconolactonase/glucosamine-6-phosphate isomerase/deaminase
MIKTYTSGNPLDEASNALTQLLKENETRDILLFFSGGSALAIVDHIHPKLLSKRHTITTLDERYTFDEKESNFSKLSNSILFKSASAQGAIFIDPRPHKGELLENTARRFDVELKQWHTNHPNGVVIATFGVGPDGHTSGILPMPEDPATFKKLFMNEKTWITGYRTTPEKNPHTDRITTTLSYLLNHITYAIVYAIGKPKKEILRKALTSEETYAE